MKTPLAVCLVFCFLNATGFSQEKFAQIRVSIPDKNVLSEVWKSGIDFEGSSGKVGGMMEFVAGEFDLQELTRRGILYQIIIDDLAEFAFSQRSTEPIGPVGFGYGSMGGFYTFAEALQQLDSMRVLYPHLISSRDSIGTSHEGRALWAVRISDNPELNEPEEPEVLYTALHHAREPQGLMTVLYYMWWLLENYGSDLEATYLVNNRQMWFIPVVNPDGYVYNQNTNPNGGGFWRKNRRNNGSSFGVDPNRNYGPFHMWNAPNGGSSTDPNSSTYRGPSPFSEPENQAIDRFMREHNVKTCFNYHTSGNLLIFPWGYLSGESSDSLLFREWSFHMIENNHYTSGTDLQTVNYSTRGNSDDYMYGDTTKPRAYTMTPEVGTTGFWPSQSEILPLAIENLPANKLLAHYAGAYANVTHSQFLDMNSNGFLERGEDFSLVLDILNSGVDDGSDLIVAVSSENPDLAFTVQQTSIPSLPARTSAQVVLTGVVSQTAITGRPALVSILITDSKGFAKNHSMTVFVGPPNVVFEDSGNNGTVAWNTGQGWGTTSHAHTPPFSFTDSPAGNYLANANNSLTLNNGIDLTGSDFAQLKFWTKWSIEPTWDFATVEVSLNNGVTWTSLQSSLSHAGSGRSGGKQLAGTWGFESYTPGLAWVEQTVDLSSYVNTIIKVRFRVSTDGSEQKDGFFVDDIRLYGYTTSADTFVTISPSSISLQGIAGTRLDGDIFVRNNSSNGVTISIAESLLTSNHFSTESPDAFATIVTDPRGDNFVYGVDVLDIQYQIRTIPVIGSLLDLKIRMLSPDSSIAGFISIDADQDFGTGRWPTPYGLGPRARDVGSEFEILVDVSGTISDSLGFGNSPVAVIFRTSDNSVVLPLFPSVTRDSVLTVTVSSIPLGSLGINDPDRRLNVAATFARLSGVVIPDFAPDWGHGVVEAEHGVSWMRSGLSSIILNPGDSAAIPFSVLAAKPPGIYNAQFRLSGIPQGEFDIPIQMIVTSLGLPHLQLSSSELNDTLSPGTTSIRDVTISNLGSTPLFWLLVDSAAHPWLEINPTFGTTDPSSSTVVSITLNSNGLSPNTLYGAQIAIISNDSAQSVRSYPVELFIRSAVSVIENESLIPKDFSLYQNFPNPFNPETTIGFDLPVPSEVRLTVYNVLGEEVALLVNGYFEPGFYQTRLSLKDHSLSTGVYFYQISAGQFSSIKKMLLLQ